MPRGIPRRQIREGIADWLIVFGALLLLLSLFLTWSHQFTNTFYVNAAPEGNLASTQTRLRCAIQEPLSTTSSNQHA